MRAVCGRLCAAGRLAAAAPMLFLIGRGVEACERLQAAGFEDCDDPAADTFDLSAWRGSGVRYAYNITDGVIVGQPYGP